MTQAALQLQAAGFELALMGDGGLVVSPKSRLTDDTRQFIKAHKQELVEYLSRHAVNDVQAQADTSDKAVNDWQQADRALPGAPCPMSNLSSRWPRQRLTMCRRPSVMGCLRSRPHAGVGQGQAGSTAPTCTSKTESPLSPPRCGYRLGMSKVSSST